MTAVDPITRKPYGKDSRAVVGLERVWLALEDTESMLARACTPTQVTAHLRKTYGIPRTVADRYQAVVRRRWNAGHERESRDQRVIRYRRMLEEIIARAHDGKETVCIGKEPDGERVYEVVAKPDLKAATAAIAVLVKLEGEQQLEPGDDGSVGDHDEGAAVVLTTAEAIEEMRERRKRGAL